MGNLLLRPVIGFLQKKLICVTTVTDVLHSVTTNLRTTKFRAHFHKGYQSYCPSIETTSVK